MNVNNFLSGVRQVGLTADTLGRKIRHICLFNSTFGNRQLFMFVSNNRCK